MIKTCAAVLAAVCVCLTVLSGCKGSGMKGTAGTTVIRETTRQSLSEKASDAMETAKEALSDAGETLRDAGETVRDGISEAGSAAESAAQEAVSELPENG